MVFYPDDSGGLLKQAWNGDKMLKGVPDNLLTPMIKHLGIIYYLNELVQCTHGGWFIPKRWITRNGSMHAVGHVVTECEVCNVSPLLVILYLTFSTTGWPQRRSQLLTNCRGFDIFL